jgi:hypothetical protein
MGFSLNDNHFFEFYSLGYTIFRAVLPPALIADLRKASERGAAIIRKKTQANIQRFQPVSAFDIDQKPYEDYRDLPALRDAFAKLLTPHHRHGNLDVMGVLIEPSERPWCTNWHRDHLHHMEGLNSTTVNYHDINFFNQINCALYEDNSTWFVPGSHLREELPSEIAAFQKPPVPGPNLEGTSAEEAEARCLAYCRRMPGAVQVHLNAGDLAVYRNILWHIGNYTPYKKRATLHDAVDTEEYVAWREERKSGQVPPRKRG